jgi:hypothetical protein
LLQTREDDDEEEGAGALTIDESPQEPEEAKPSMKQKTRKNLGGKRPFTK